MHLSYVGFQLLMLLGNVSFHVFVAFLIYSLPFTVPLYKLTPAPENSYNSTYNPSNHVTPDISRIPRPCRWVKEEVIEVHFFAPFITCVATSWRSIAWFTGVSLRVLAVTSPDLIICLGISAIDFISSTWNSWVVVANCAANSA